MRNTIRETINKYSDLAQANPFVFVRGTWIDLLSLAEGDDRTDLVEDGFVPDLPTEAWQEIVEALKPAYKAALWKISS